MKKQLTKKFLLWFTISGSIASIFYVLIVIFLDMQFHQLPFTFQNIKEIHRIDKILYFVDITPFILIPFSFFVGKALGNFAQKQADSNYETERKSKKLYDFIEKIRIGDKDANYEADDDLLGDTLINLRDELSAKEVDDARRKEEDDQRHWATQGLAHFGGILRENSDDLETLSNSVISELVKYIDAKQAGLFVINDTDRNNVFIEQTASFAYGRKKFTDKKIEWGEGLVGACILEQKTIFVDKVSEGYVEITSGLGKANPRSILVVPLKVNDEIYGVLELASFKVYEEFEIKFIETIAESIGATISSLKTNLRTSKLLIDSQNTAKTMERQEEEMHRNMDELKQTQIEAAEQAEQFISFTNSVNHTLIRSEYSVEGNLLYANSKFLEKMGYESSEVQDIHISSFINSKDIEWFDKLWRELAEGGPHFEGDMKHVAKDGSEMWTMATYVSVRDQHGKPRKILFLGIDTTVAKQSSLDYKGQIDALERSTLKAEFKPDGKAISFNEKFLEKLDFTENELKQKFIFDFVSIDDINDFRASWQKVLKGVSADGQTKLLTKNNETKWFQGTFTAVYDMYGEIAKIVYIANDISFQVISQQKIQEQNEKLTAQENKLHNSQKELSVKLEEAKHEMKAQFNEIEIVKLLNEKTLEGMLDAVVMINEKSKIEFFNAAAEQLWNVEKNEVLGKSISSILPAEYAALEGEYMGDHFRSGEKIKLGNRSEVFIIDQNGDQIFVLMTLSEAQIGKRYSLTAFVQQIEVELF